MTLIVAEVLDETSLAVAADSLIDWQWLPPEVERRPVHRRGAPKLYLLDTHTIVGFAGDHAHLDIELILLARKHVANTDPQTVATFLRERMRESEQFLVACTREAPSITTVHRSSGLTQESFGWIGDREAYARFHDCGTLSRPIAFTSQSSACSCR